ncbi:hypothetical protein Tco_1080254 [Tanacetum coccineum]|uniref:Uncharacterized protein n=1 Tax=Tanacetum coccineum TaxID=301880 RepID=A0ABQ5HVF6_9ASTR
MGHSDPEEDPEEDLTDYPADKGDDDDDDDESSDDDEDDDDDVEEDEDKEEEHPALADSVPPHVHRVMARMSVRAQTPILLPSDTEVARLLAIHTPPPLPLSPLSSPLPQILSPLRVANALATRDIDRSRNGEDSHDSGTGVRRQAPLARECTYLDFMKYKPLYFKGTEGVIKLT